MTKHRFAWTNFLFGIFFLAVVGNWIAQRQDTITLEQLGIAGPLLLIVLGAAGIGSTMWKKG